MGRRRRERLFGPLSLLLSGLEISLGLLTVVLDLLLVEVGHVVVRGFKLGSHIYGYGFPRDVLVCWVVGVWCGHLTMLIVVRVL